MNLCQSLREHWPEYLMEAWGLGMFMMAAGLVVVVMEAPISPVPNYIPDANLRRAVIGVAMGLTAIGIIYSPWGKQTGAHINPAVTLSFLRLGKITGWDALFYMLFQFIGGTLGVMLAALVLGNEFTSPPVNWVVTIPGSGGIRTAFVAETGISFGLMLTVLVFINRPSLERYTGLAAGVLVTSYVTFEAPYSGFSINPARSFASALPSGIWTAMWIYFTAPVLGMLAAVETYRLLKFSRERMCAKLIHARERRCIHCGYDPKTGKSRPQTLTLTTENKS